MDVPSRTQWHGCGVGVRKSPTFFFQGLSSAKARDPRSPLFPCPRKEHAVLRGGGAHTTPTCFFLSVLQVFRGTLLTANLDTSFIHRTRMKKSSSSLTHHTFQMFYHSAAATVHLLGFAAQQRQLFFWHNVSTWIVRFLCSRVLLTACRHLHPRWVCWEQRQTKAVTTQNPNSNDLKSLHTRKNFVHREQNSQPRQTTTK